MTDEDRTRLDRIEQLLLEVLSELRGPRPSRRRNRKTASPAPAVSDLDRARAARVLDKLGLRRGRRAAGHRLAPHPTCAHLFYLSPII